MHKATCKIEEIVCGGGGFAGKGTKGYQDTFNWTDVRITML